MKISTAIAPSSAVIYTSANHTHIRTISRRKPSTISRYASYQPSLQSQPPFLLGDLLAAATLGDLGSTFTKPLLLAFCSGVTGMIATSGILLGLLGLGLTMLLLLLLPSPGTTRLSTLRMLLAGLLGRA